MERSRFSTSGRSTVRQSGVRTWLNDKFFAKLLEDGAEESAFDLLKLNLTSDDALDDYGTVTAKIGLITCDMYRRFRRLIPKIAKWWWTCTPWSTPSGSSTHYVRRIDTSGALSSNSAGNGFGSVRPICALKSDIAVSVKDRVKG